MPVESDLLNHTQVRGLYVQVGLAFQLDEELPQAGGLSLDLHLDPSVWKVPDPAGQIKTSGKVQCSVSETDMLDLARKHYMPSLGISQAVHRS